jgi:hypothetical protein
MPSASNEKMTFATFLRFAAGLLIALTITTVFMPTMFMKIVFSIFFVWFSISVFRKAHSSDLLHGDPKKKGQVVRTNEKASRNFTYIAVICSVVAILLEVAPIEDRLGKIYSSFVKLFFTFYLIGFLFSIKVILEEWDLESRKKRLATKYLFATTVAALALISIVAKKYAR